MNVDASNRLVADKDRLTPKVGVVQACGLLTQLFKLLSTQVGICTGCGLGDGKTQRGLFRLVRPSVSKSRLSSNFHFLAPTLLRET